MELKFVKEIASETTLRILLAIKEEGKANWKVIIERTGLSQSTIDSKLKQLQRLRLIEPTPEISEVTGRPIKPYHLTEHGKAVLEKLEELEELLQAITETPSEEEKKELINKALSGRLKYDKEVVAGRDREV